VSYLSALEARLLRLKHCTSPRLLYIQDEAKSAFDEWLKVKKEQQKKLAKDEQEREKEVQPETKKRSKKDAERAFKKYARLC